MAAGVLPPGMNARSTAGRQLLGAHWAKVQADKDAAEAAAAAEVAAAAAVAGTSTSASTSTRPTKGQ